MPADEPCIQDHRKVVFEELEFSMQMSEAEQRRRLSPDLPSIKDYMACRLGSGAVNICEIFNECVETVAFLSCLSFAGSVKRYTDKVDYRYSLGMNINSSLLTDPNVRRLRELANMIIWV